MSTDTISINTLLAKARFESSGIGSNLVIGLAWQEPVLTLKIRGSSSDNLPDSFTSAIAQALRGVKSRHVAVDLTGCDSLPSVILAFLVFFQKTAEEQGASKVVLYGVNQRIRTVIKMIGMLDFFVLQNDEAAMQAWFAKG
jgi:anti-anti-sigma regulatory factor